MLATMLMLAASFVCVLVGPIVTYHVCARARDVNAPAEPASSLLGSRWLGGIAGLLTVALIAATFAALSMAAARWSNLSIALGLVGSFPLDDAPAFPWWQAPLMFGATAVWLAVGLAVQGFVAGQLVLRWGYRGVPRDQEHARLIRRTVFRAEWIVAALIVLVPAAYVAIAMVVAGSGDLAQPK